MPPKNKDKKTMKKTIKGKSAVKKQNRFRTEYKDRISPVLASNLGTVAGSITNGPADSVVLVPGALTALFTQGTANGQVEANQFNPRFLNLKMKLNFDNLPAFVTSDGAAATPQQYNLHVRSGLILEDISEYLTDSYTNTTSGRVQPAFPDSSAVPALYSEVAKKFLFNANIQPEFLSYEKRLDTKVRILSSRRVLGSTTSRLQAGPTPGVTGGDHIISPEKHLTFNWKMPKDKQSLSPALRSGGFDGVSPARMWVPFVCVTLNRSVVDDDVATNLLNISSISHFTYTDS